MNPGLAQRSCYTDLAVLPRPIQLANIEVDPEAGSFFINSQTVNCTDLKSNTPITQQAFKPIADVPAYLIRGPDDCTALIGGTICLTVTYGGYPKPSIKWLRAVSSFYAINCFKIKHSIMFNSIAFCANKNPLYLAFVVEEFFFSMKIANSRTTVVLSLTYFAFPSVNNSVVFLVL